MESDTQVAGQQVSSPSSPTTNQGAILNKVSDSFSESHFVCRPFSSESQTGHVYYAFQATGVKKNVIFFP